MFSRDSNPTSQILENPAVHCLRKFFLWRQFLMRMKFINFGKESVWALQYLPKADEEKIFWKVKMIIRIDVLKVLQNLLSNVSLRTPHRIEYITKTLQSYVSTLIDNTLQVLVDIDLPNGDVHFCPIECHILHWSTHMVRYKTEKNQFMEPPAFIPSTTICCSKKIRINPRASQVRIYTKNRILEGLNYHGLCKECKMKFYRHWTESKDGYRSYFTHPCIDYYSHWVRIFPLNFHCWWKHSHRVIF